MGRESKAGTVVTPSVSSSIGIDFGKKHGMP